MSRFFVKTDAADLLEGRIMITGEDVKHIAGVLRASAGDALVLSDGSGTEYDVVIRHISKESIETGIKSQRPCKTEPPIHITLFQGIPKADKMDLIIQKSVELGVTKIVPVMTARTVVRFGSTRDAAAKAVRWNRIALEAAKQCDRGVIPVVGEPVTFDMALKIAGECELKLLPYEEEKEGSLRSVLRSCGKTAGSIAVLIGPEGGFERDEAEKAVNAGFISVTMGPRILRTETAGLAAAAIVMYELGDMGGS
jgi:16S rRNA (uracil1498-N3)-methyltransferase